jgi:hypothetical protein
MASVSSDTAHHPLSNMFDIHLQVIAKELLYCWLESYKLSFKNQLDLTLPFDIINKLNEIQRAETQNDVN